MGVDAGSVYSSIRIRLGDLDNDLKGVYARLNQLEDNITKTTKAPKKATNAFTESFNNLTKSFITGQIAVDAIKKGLSILVGSIKESIQISIDAQETFSKYDTVFSGMGKSAENAANEFANSFDLAGVSAKDMLSNTGNLLQGFGATREESLKLSVQVNTLASDLASFTNYSGGAKGASEALTKALLGEREQAKTLGIAILESDVQTRLAAKGQSGLTGTALKLAKANVTLELITEQAKNSIGDYARTHDSASNSIKRSKEATLELQVALGTALNPAAALSAELWTKVATAMTNVIKSQNELKKAKDDQKQGNVDTRDRVVLIKDEIKKVDILTSKYLPLPGILKLVQLAAKIASKQRLDDLGKELSGLSVQTAAENNIERYKQEYAENEKKRIQKTEDRKKESAEKEDERKAAEQKQILDRIKAEDEYNTALDKTAFMLKNNLITPKQAMDSNNDAAKKYLDTLYELGYAADSEIGTKGYEALKKMLSLVSAYNEEQSTQTERYEYYKELLSSISDLDVEHRENALAGLKEQIEASDMDIEKKQEVLKLLESITDATAKAKTENDIYLKSTQAGVQNLLTGFESIGEAIATGTLSWDDFAKMGLTAIAAVLEAFGAELAILAAKGIAEAWGTAGASLISVAPSLAGSAAAYTAAGVLRGFAGSFADGGIVPGDSYTGDQLIARVNSGEEVITRDDPRNTLNGGGNAVFILEVDGLPIAQATAPYFSNGQVRLKLK